MTCDEQAGLRLLRHLIPVVDGGMHGPRKDQGWCCTDHALIATLAFVFAGIRVHLCDGAVLINHDDVIYDVIPHSFVSTDEPNWSVFDSSITCDKIEGIPIGYKSAYTFLDVASCEGIPDEKTYRELLRDGGTPTLALYGIKHRITPDHRLLDRPSGTQLGQWIVTRYGHHKGLWAKAAWHVAESFRGEGLDHSPLSRESLWDTIEATEDKDDIMLYILSS